MFDHEAPRVDDILIAPSVLSADILDLGAELDAIGDADLVHFDVMDGNFVPNLSFGPAVLKAVKGRTSLPVDAHLMISNPDTMVDAYLDAGADIVTVHYEATPHPHRVVSHIRERGAKAGIALNPGTPVCMLDPLVRDVDMVLLMSVNPGYGGQSFIESTIQKLHDLAALCRRHKVSPWVEVDGGVGASNASRICAAGANVLVAGSSVYGAQDRGLAIRELRAAAVFGALREA